MSQWILLCFLNPDKIIFSKCRHYIVYIFYYVYHTVIIQDLRTSFLIFTPKNSQFLKPQNLLQLLIEIIDLFFIRDKNNIMTKLYEKRDRFGFHIVNFPFMSSNIPSAPAYGVYASQLIRYARCCLNYSDFLLRHRVLVTRLLSQGYKVNRLSNTFKKFYGRHTDPRIANYNFVWTFQLRSPAEYAIRVTWASPNFVEGHSM